MSLYTIGNEHCVTHNIDLKQINKKEILSIIKLPLIEKERGYVHTLKVVVVFLILSISSIYHAGSNCDVI